MEPEDAFNTNEFKALPLRERLWIRFKIALIVTLSTY